MYAPEPAAVLNFAPIPSPGSWLRLCTQHLDGGQSDADCLTPQLHQRPSNSGKRTQPALNPRLPSRVCHLMALIEDVLPWRAAVLGQASQNWVSEALIRVSRPARGRWPTASPQTCRPPLTSGQNAPRVATRPSPYAAMTPRRTSARNSFLSPAKSRANLATRDTHSRDGYLCQLRYRGCTVQASIADHIETSPTEASPEHKQLTPNDLQAVCLTCHQIKTNQETTGRPHQVEREA
jgi:5-methylcytosine-specific restriction endonuclease McrA